MKPLIRLIKAIKFYNNISMLSFYLELRVAKYASGESYIKYDDDVYRALRHLVNVNLAQMVDPAGISGYVPAAHTENYRQESLSKHQRHSLTQLASPRHTVQSGQDSDPGCSHQAKTLRSN